MLPLVSFSYEGLRWLTVSSHHHLHPRALGHHVADAKQWVGEKVLGRSIWIWFNTKHLVELMKLGRVLQSGYTSVAMPPKLREYSGKKRHTAVQSVLQHGLCQDHRMQLLLLSQLWHQLSVRPWTALLSFFIRQTGTIMTGYLTSGVYKFASGPLVPAECYGVVGVIKDLMELFLCFAFARVRGALPQASWQTFQLPFCCRDERGHVSPRKCVLSKKEETSGKGLLFCKISFAEFTRCQRLLILHALVPWDCKQSFNMPFCRAIYQPPSFSLWLFSTFFFLSFPPPSHSFALSPGLIPIL